MPLSNITLKCMLSNDRGAEREAREALLVISGDARSALPTSDEKTASLPPASCLLLPTSTSDVLFPTSCLVGMALLWRRAQRSPADAADPHARKGGTRRSRPPVLAQVRSDAIGACLFGQLGGPYGVRKAHTPGISDGRHMIDIHAQSRGEYAHVHDIVSFCADDCVA